MQESQIVESQKARIPQPEQAAPAPATPPEAIGFGNAAIDLDELTQYKLHDLFEVQYNPKDNDAKKHLDFIYSKVSDMSEQKEYPFVAAKIRELMRVAGIARSERKMGKMYEWLRLADVSKQVHSQMENLRDVG